MVRKGKKGWVGAGELLLFCLGSFLLFFPILGRTFASDDFEVVWRVARGDFRTPGFFRPLSDWTLYLNYRLGGFRPAGYYAFNILVHGINAYLLYRLCLVWEWTEERRRQRRYALLAALLFLAYPFHDEGIVWILGRGASLAVLFGLCAMILAADESVRKGGVLWAGCFYFMGMLAYETGILLPLFCLLILYVRGAGVKEMVRWAFVMGGVLVLHGVLRVVVSGGILGEYERDFFGPAWWQYGGNAGRVAMRLLLPPTDDHGVLLAVFVVVLAVLLIVMGVFYRRVRQRERRLYLAGLFGLLCLAGIVPVLSAVSTRTSESDRLLYFPSVFLCCLLAYLLVVIVKRRGWVGVVSVLLLGYMIWFLEKNNRNWVEASDMTRGILTGVKGQSAGEMAADQSAGGKTFIINLPDEKDGAYIFRLGFPQALLMAGVDTGKVVVVNHLTRSEELEGPDRIEIEKVNGQEMDIFPGTDIRRLGQDLYQIENRGLGRDSGVRRFWLGRADRILYWDKRRLLPVLFFIY